jgi:tripartite-type tricarboxylate transporter receptor subunit TctC
MPGKPTIVVQNQLGAGSVIMVNALYNTAPRDGSVIGAAINGAPTAPLFTPKAARFDPTKLNWIGSTNRDTQVFYVWHTAPTQGLEDLKTTEVLVGATNPGTTQVDFPKVAAEVLGLKFKIVSGYKGTHEIHLAMERGEVQGMGSNGWLSLKALNSDWLRDKKVRLIAVYNEQPDPELKEVPSVFSLAKTEDDRQALRLLVSRLEYGRPFFLPPDVPPARVEALRRAFDETMKDPAYLAEAEKLKIDVDPLSGEKVAQLISLVLATPPAIAERVAAALEGGAK